MKTLTGKKIILRALEPTDLDFLYILENDEEVWEVSNTTTPYSKFVLKQYLENAHRDIYEVKQLRLAICMTASERPLGFVDLFDFDPKHNKVGVGIVVFGEENRRKGFACEALQLICNYCFTHLNMHQVYANITEDNKGSIVLFEKAGFVQSGVKKDWILSEGSYKNELLFQLLR
ncbi:diamine N-acetyltransferase [Ulvibacter sp. MAR_2010_11]|uniref:GNAT family N-acetyltransferase n=1 Tax=Ulvibacter sp. MAR_2010_11 TaxID=1250229 RepID=UPI000C2B936D|nr:GNAT family protein [Ulvibacter sp. MAR_2010_11]PKA81914.1 diamine N-acetyltransferase [Ulvibacter sp. MAR_2010_11]